MSNQSRAINLMTKDANVRQKVDNQNLAALNKADRAQVIITVTKFRPILNIHKGIPTVDIQMRMGKDNPLLDAGTDKQGKLALVFKKPDPPSAILKGSVIIEFSVVALKGEKVYYFPIGIGYKRKKVSGGLYQPADVLARKAFAETHTHFYSNRLFITYDYDSTNPNDRFEFYVVIQESVYGRIGVIDPGVGNDYK